MVTRGGVGGRLSVVVEGLQGRQLALWNYPVAGWRRRADFDDSKRHRLR